MARSNYPYWTGNSNVQVISFSFAPQGTSQPVMVRSEGVNVVRGGSAGVFTATFNDQYYDLVDFSADVGNFLANDIRPGVFTASPAAGGGSTLTITSFADATTGAVAAEIAAGANNIVRCTVVLATGKAVGL
jgi:hypothetical protein